MNFPYFPGAELRAVLERIRARGTAHDRHWRAHPAVPTGDALTFGQRAADHMKAIFSTWTALGVILLFMAFWLATGGFGRDPMPFILLNLCLSCLAALQCFILLIAAKRADQIAAAIALHTLDNTQDIKTLIEQNTALTEQVAELTRAVHDSLTAAPVPVPTALQKAGVPCPSPSPSNPLTAASSPGTSGVTSSRPRKRSKP